MQDHLARQLANHVTADPGAEYITDFCPYVFGSDRGAQQHPDLYQ